MSQPLLLKQLSVSIVFAQAGSVKAAVDCCVLLGEWELAVKLAEEHRLPQIGGLLAKYA